MTAWIVASVLNRWRYAVILWLERSVYRWEYRIGMWICAAQRRRDERCIVDALRRQDYHGYALAMAAYWKRWQAGRER